METWRKSSYSSTSANCVELADGEKVMAVRDSKNVGVWLTLPAPAVRELLASVKAIHPIR